VQADRLGYWCGACWQELTAIVGTARFVLGNFDILLGQQWTLGGGVDIGDRHDLPGWAHVLAGLQWDVAIVDEIQWLRGRADKTQRKFGLGRNERLRISLSSASYAWGLTGTLFYGHVRDIYTPLDILSGGLFGERHIGFDQRYCEGHVNAHGGWEAKGRSLLAESELRPRLQTNVFIRQRSELAQELPTRDRHILKLDSARRREDFRFGGAAPDPEGTARAAALRAELDDTLPVLVSNVIEGLLEGTNQFVLTFLTDSAERIHDAILKAMTDPAVRSRLQALVARAWCEYGDDAKKRFDRCAEYVQHITRGGVGVFISTIDSMQGVVSLRGANIIHIAELHHSPSPLQQALERPGGPGVSGLFEQYYQVRGGANEHLQRLLIPKLATQLAMSGDELAADLLNFFAPTRKTETPDEVWAKMRARWS
jgi:hypothetical protein